MHCPQCGSVVRDQATYCYRCGAVIESPAAPETPPAPLPPAGATRARLPKGLGVGSLVCGILSIVFWCVAFVSFPLGVIAVFMGAIGISRAGRGMAGGRGMAIAGLVCGIIGGMAGGWMLLVTGAWMWRGLPH